MNSRLLKDRLLELEMTPEQLAVKIDRSFSTVSNMLAERGASRVTLYRTAKAIGVPVEDLLGQKSQQTAG